MKDEKKPDDAVLFARIRRWSPSGIGAMSMFAIQHQMGGRPGADPYGWKRTRIYAAFEVLMGNGSLKGPGPAGDYYVTEEGIRRYETKPELGDGLPLFDHRPMGGSHAAKSV